MPGFRDFEPFERDDREFSGIDAGDLSFLQNLSLDADEQMNAADYQLHEFDLAAKKDQYEDIIERRQELITAFMGNRSHQPTKNTLASIEVLAHAFFDDYVDGILRTPAGHSDPIKQIAAALWRADSSQLQMNTRLGRWSQFDDGMLESTVLGIITMTANHREAHIAMSSLYQAYIKDVAMGFINDSHG